MMNEQINALNEKVSQKQGLQASYQRRPYQVDQQNDA